MEFKNLRAAYKPLSVEEARQILESSIELNGKSEEFYRLLRTVFWLRSNVEGLLKQISIPKRCEGCGAVMYFVHHRSNDKVVPYTADGLNHFVDCPAREQFRKAPTNANETKS